MRQHYYVVYSVSSKLGSGFGRNTISADKPINSMDRIKQVEDELLKACQETEPEAGYGQLFLVNWREIDAPRDT